MKNDIKGTWVEDLRSGKFPQASGVLVGEVEIGDHTVVGYCCLGVLTDQYVRTHPNGDLKWSADGLTLYQRCEAEEEEYAEYSDATGHWNEFTDNDLPNMVADWAGITGKRGEGETVTVTRDTHAYQSVERDMKSNPLIGGVGAIYRNDNAHETFEQIADAIEKDETL
jgi:hypothetical protein